MVKDDYIKELAWDGIVQKGDNGFNVERVQEWFCIWTYFSPTWNWKLIIDGDYGPATKATAKKFQQYINNTDLGDADLLEVDGEVGPKTFQHLCMPMRQAFTALSPQSFDKRESIMFVAEAHLNMRPVELNGKNEGPWVRAYMGGHDGNPWAWCVGSAQTVIDQALSHFGIKFTDFMPRTYSCDEFAMHGIKNNCLIRNSDLRSMAENEIKHLVKPGDLFLRHNSGNDWTHNGIITEVHKNYFETWEGNTNDEGSREGYEVCTRIRNFHRQDLDVYRLAI